jgi:hypothetical protein
MEPTSERAGPKLLQREIQHRLPVAEVDRTDEQLRQTMAPYAPPNTSLGPAVRRLSSRKTLTIYGF